MTIASTGATIDDERPDLTGGRHLTGFYDIWKEGSLHPSPGDVGQAMGEREG